MMAFACTYLYSVQRTRFPLPFSHLFTHLLIWMFFIYANNYLFEHVLFTLSLLSYINHCCMANVDFDRSNEHFQSKAVIPSTEK